MPRSPISALTKRLEGAEEKKILVINPTILIISYQKTTYHLYTSRTKGLNFLKVNLSIKYI